MEVIKQVSQNQILKKSLYIILGSILLIVSAKIKIPFYPVPMTMQTFVVLLIGIMLGPKLGILTVIVYLLEGIFGLPVFSNSPEKGVGLMYFTGPTMGYLIGFLFATYLSGYLNLETNYFLIFFKLIFSVSIIYILGVIWLGSLIGWEKPVFNLGVKPFLLAELFKILILTFLTKNLLKIRKII